MSHTPSHMDELQDRLSSQVGGVHSVQVSSTAGAAVSAGQINVNQTVQALLIELQKEARVTGPKVVTTIRKLKAELAKRGKKDIVVSAALDITLDTDMNMIVEGDNTVLQLPGAPITVTVDAPTTTADAVFDLQSGSTFKLRQYADFSMNGLGSSGLPPGFSVFKVANGPTDAKPKVTIDIAGEASTVTLSAGPDSSGNPTANLGMGTHGLTLIGLLDPILFSIRGGDPTVAKRKKILGFASVLVDSNNNEIAAQTITNIYMEIWRLWAYQIDSCTIKYYSKSRSSFAGKPCEFRAWEVNDTNIGTTTGDGIEWTDADKAHEPFKIEKSAYRVTFDVKMNLSVSDSGYTNMFRWGTSSDPSFEGNNIYARVENTTTVPLTTFQLHWWTHGRLQNSVIDVSAPTLPPWKFLSNDSIFENLVFSGNILSFDGATSDLLNCLLDKVNVNIFTGIIARHIRYCNVKLDPSFFGSPSTIAPGITAVEIDGMTINWNGLLPTVPVRTITVTAKKVREFSSINGAADSTYVPWPGEKLDIYVAWSDAGNMTFNAPSDGIVRDVVTNGNITIVPASPNTLYYAVSPLPGTGLLTPGVATKI